MLGPLVSNIGAFFVVKRLRSKRYLVFNCRFACFVRLRSGVDQKLHNLTVKTFASQCTAYPHKWLLVDPLSVDGLPLYAQLLRYTRMFRDVTVEAACFPNAVRYFGFEALSGGNGCGSRLRHHFTLSSVKISLLNASDVGSCFGWGRSQYSSTDLVRTDISYADVIIAGGVV
ncbi:hypothetical protein TSMEX_011266 [Taenia solium]|eukprot:TsM_000313300 transcript=TsM_000313300 gene=TsM_000313300